ncbi:hypothetical protein HOV93_20750 [Planctomycetes bacterium FF15]|uniref:Uncharacterized protein n=1 Tax=Bremerella alba TaxID=980252 RepID=A0A7V9A701_9BACT|nr:hypothetical protein [Bremerella alba]
MDIGLVIAMLACVVCGIAYSIYAVVMGWRISSIRPHAIAGMMVNLLFILLIVIVVVS